MIVETATQTMISKRYILVLCLLSLILVPARAQQGQNRPYVDDKLFHFGFQLGVNFASFGITDTQDSIQNPIDPEDYDVYHARVSSILPGFHVGFITDLRLCRYLNLRFCPGIQFTNRTISYKAESGRPVSGTPGTGNKVDVLAIPVNLPLYLKWSAAREGNYRPYVIAGGGASINVSRDSEKAVMLNLMDYFAEVGFGVDLYFRWFKFCPEITYRIGFADQLCPINKRTDQLAAQDYFYTNAIQRMTSHCICLTFNFE